MKICDKCFREIPEGEATCSCNANDEAAVTLKRPISHGLAVGIMVLPFFFSFYTLREGYSTTQRLVAFWWVWAMVLAVFFIPEGTQSVGEREVSSQQDAKSTEQSGMASSMQSPYITFDGNNVAEMKVSSKTLSEQVRLENMINMLVDVTRFANMNLKSKGRDEVRKYQALLDNSDSYDTSRIGIEGATIRREFPSGLEFYCRDTRIISPDTDLSECQFTRNIAGLSVLLRDPITIDIPCVIEGFDKGKPYCRHQRLRDWGEREEIEHTFYRINADAKGNNELFVGDFVITRLRYFGKLDFDPEHQTTQVNLLEREYLSLVTGTLNTIDCFSEAAPNNNKWRNTEYYEEVLGDDWFRDSEYRCGYWVKN